MKKLSFFLFALLILGCGTETTVVEQPVVEEPVVEKPKSAVEEPAPIYELPASVFEVPEPKPISSLPPQIAAASVRDGDVDVDPEPLNRNGIVVQFLGNLNMYTASLWGPGALHWSPRDVVDRGAGNRVHLKPMADSKLLEYDKKYTIAIYAQNFECHGARTLIEFRTKSR